MMQDRVRKALQNRKNVKDTFRTENGYSWDYVMIFNIYKNDQKLSKMQERSAFPSFFVIKFVSSCICLLVTRHSMKNILNDLADGGLQTKLFYSAKVSYFLTKT